MHRIEKITLKNFKFFYGEVPIHFDCKNVLLYGENGSGKSCIYWALYTFFKSVFKSQNTQISKYFDPAKPENLKNHFAWNRASFIKIQFRNDRGTLIEKRISQRIINIENVDFLKEASIASDFLNYKLLAKMYAFKNKEEIDWFSLFESEVLTLINFKQIFTRHDGSIGNNNALDWWLYLKKVRFKKKVKEIDKFEESIKRFNSEFNYFLNSILESANEILTIKFNQPLKILFNYKECEFGPSNVNTRYKSATTPVLKISVEFKNDKLKHGNTNLKKPHIYLNEAKLTAIALSIRFAILREKYITDAPKILILDDLLISLDMSHRNIVLDYILSELKDYQTILMTHDKHFFEITKNKIKNYNQSNWKYLEIYDTEKNNITQPIIIDSKSYFEKAEVYFHKKEYEVAGNFLRKEAEKFCKEFLPKRRQYSRDFDVLNLDSLINQCLIYARESYLDQTLFINLDSHRQFVLNPSSHDSYDVPKFNSEISNCLTNIKNLRKIKYDTILNHNDKLEFELTDVNGTDIYQFEIIIQDDFRLIKLNGSDSVIGSGMINYYVYKNGTKGSLQHKSENLKRMYESAYKDSDKLKRTDFWEEIIIQSSGEELGSLRLF